MSDHWTCQQSPRSPSWGSRPATSTPAAGSALRTRGPAAARGRSPPGARSSAAPATTPRSPKDKFTSCRARRTSGGATTRCSSWCIFITTTGSWRPAATTLTFFDGYAGADPRDRLRVRVITECAWHNLFARNMFVRGQGRGELRDFAPEFTVLDLPSVHGDRAADGTRSATFIVRPWRADARIQRTQQRVRSTESVMNYALPSAASSMHSASYGASKDDVALFFGLSGTGNTIFRPIPAARRRRRAWRSRTAFSTSRRPATPR